MRVALDTNRLTDLFRGDVELAELLGSCEEVWIPLIVLGEIKAGFQGQQNEALLQRLLNKPSVRILLPGIETAEFYSKLFVQLKHAGTPIPDNDLWIAALTLEKNLSLITRDPHFKFVPQLLLD
jgi:tRNA(fMet)-specific endonuclease VapC